LSGTLVSGLSGAVSGFVTGDTLANSTSGAPAWTTSATALSAPGSYAIDGGGLTSGNYVFAQADSNATSLTVVLAPPAPPTTPPAPPTPPSVAWLESSVLTVPANGPSLTFGTSQTLNISPAVDTPQSTAAPAAASTSGNSTAGSSGNGYNSQVFEATADFGGGKLRIENGGVRLPDSPPGAH
jgi:hypothetical protein